MSTDEILTRRLAEGIQIRLEPASGTTWRYRVRESVTSEWGSLRAPNHPGFSTPLLAAEDADTRIAALLASRQDAGAEELMTTIGQLLVADRLEKRVRQGEQGLEVVWIGTFADGTKTAPQPTPREAARRVLRGDRDGA
jgi:hypothetical protein